MVFYEESPDEEKDILIAFEFLGQTVIKEGRYDRDKEVYHDYDGEVIDNVIGWSHKPPVILFK